MNSYESDGARQLQPGNFTPGAERPFEELSYLTTEVLETFLSAERIAGLIEPTPTEPSSRLSELTSSSVYLKREDMQLVHSFKIRGAANKMLQLSQDEQTRGAITASAGNHAQGVALAAQRLGIGATVNNATTTPEVKVNAVRSFNAEVILVGDNYTHAQDYLSDLLRTDKRTLIHPFEDMDVIRGQGTIGIEILNQCPDVTHVFIPGGGGGLAAGVSKILKALKPDVKVIVVEPEESNCIQLSFVRGKATALPHPPAIFADGVAVQKPGELTMRDILQYVDEVITVNDDEISTAIVNFWQDNGVTPEGAGALSEAGMVKYAAENNQSGNVYVGIVSGTNISPDKFRKALERAELARGKQALFSVRLAEKAGSLRKFCTDVVNGHNITELHYRHSYSQQAHAFIGFSMNGRQDKITFIEKLSSAVYQFHDLTEDDFAKDYLRY